MRKWVVLALIAVPLLIVLTLPAALIIPRFDPPPAMSSYGGTIWSGNARWVQAGQVPMRLTWRWSGGLTWRWEAMDTTSQLQGEWRPGDTTDLSNITGRLDLDRVDLAHWLVATRPAGYLDLAIDSAILQTGEVPQVHGQVIWEQARLEGSIQESLGRIQIELEHKDGQQLARLRSLDPAPIQVRGEIVTDADSYSADIWLRASNDRPDLAAQIGALGERQSDGQVRLRVRGALGW